MSASAFGPFDEAEIRDRRLVPTFVPSPLGRLGSAELDRQLDELRCGPLYRDAELAVCDAACADLCDPASGDPAERTDSRLDCEMAYLVAQFAWPHARRDRYAQDALTHASAFAVNAMQRAADRAEWVRRHRADRDRAVIAVQATVSTMGTFLLASSPEILRPGDFAPNAPGTPAWRIRRHVEAIEALPETRRGVVAGVRGLDVEMQRLDARMAYGACMALGGLDPEAAKHAETVALDARLRVARGKGRSLRRPGRAAARAARLRVYAAALRLAAQDVQAHLDGGGSIGDFLDPDARRASTRPASTRPAYRLPPVVSEVGCDRPALESA